jgi:hypothetical protein
MIAMTPFDVYRHYLALRLHFTTDKYDVIKQQGRVRATKESFLKRRDLVSITRVAESYSDKDVVEFLVANFISGDRWGGVFNTDAKERYLDWKKRIESMSYNFEKEIKHINNLAEDNNREFKDLFSVQEGQHPPIVKMYMKGVVSIETLVILNKLNSFASKLDLELKDDLVWPDISRIVKKYSPFLSVNKEKYNAILKRSIGYITE